MKCRLLTVLAAAALSVSLAQRDSGVVVAVDEFTGVGACSQIVVVGSSDPTGVAIFKDDEADLVLIGIFRGPTEDPAFDPFTAMPGDVVFIRWPDGTVRTYDPTGTDFSFEFDYEMALLEGAALMNDILASPGNLRVRFSGSLGEFDFTVPHSIVVALANGFGKECID